MNGERYRQMLQTLFRDTLNIWFQQGPYCQTHSTDVEKSLLWMLNSSVWQPNWPARSPDLTTGNFFSVGIPQTKGVSNQTTLYQDLNYRTQAEVPGLLQCVNNFLARL